MKMGSTYLLRVVGNSSTAPSLSPFLRTFPCSPLYKPLPDLDQPVPEHPTFLCIHSFTITPPSRHHRHDAALYCLRCRHGSDDARRRLRSEHRRPSHHQRPGRRVRSSRLDLDRVPDHPVHRLELCTRRSQLSSPFGHISRSGHCRRRHVYHHLPSHLRQHSCQFVHYTCCHQLRFVLAWCHCQLGLCHLDHLLDCQLHRHHRLVLCSELELLVHHQLQCHIHPVHRHHSDHSLLWRSFSPNWLVNQLQLIGFYWLGSGIELCIGHLISFGFCIGQSIGFSICIIHLVGFGFSIRL
jgi:hypothetical protein